MVGGGKALLYAMEVDLQVGDQLVLAAFQDLDAAAPGEEFRIIFDLGDQVNICSVL